MWEIQMTDVCYAWFKALDDSDRENILASIRVLENRGPMLSRPHADSVKGSKHSNMKELRIHSRKNPIRAFFAFDPNRTCVILFGGHKTGKKKRFYEEMVSNADREFSTHLGQLTRGK